MIDIRPATEDDFTAITAIYAWNVDNGTGTFALEAPAREEMLAAFAHVQFLRLPYLVATEGDTVLGYAYAAPFRSRPAYKYGVEDSIYLAPEATGRGIGKALLLTLMDICTVRGLYSMIAVIGDSENLASIAVHKTCGFEYTGNLPRAGFKFDRWLDVVFMTRDLRPFTLTPEGDGWDDQVLRLR
jgi:L-amino acid N-acyltransferase YncA